MFVLPNLLTTELNFFNGGIGVSQLIKLLETTPKRTKDECNQEIKEVLGVIVELCGDMLTEHKEVNYEYKTWKLALELWQDEHSADKERNECYKVVAAEFKDKQRDLINSYLTGLTNDIEALNKRAAKN